MSSFAQHLLNDNDHDSSICPLAKFSTALIMSPKSLQLLLSVQKILVTCFLILKIDNDSLHIFQLRSNILNVYVYLLENKITQLYLQMYY